MQGSKQQRKVALDKALFAVQALGRGFDVTLDLKLEYCKRSQSRLIDISESDTHDLLVPGDLVIQGVSKDIRCGSGEFTRYRSDILDFHQMSERFNQGLSVSGKMPLGLFTAMYDFKGPWQADAAATKSLALDGCFISLYELRVTKAPLTLAEEVKQAVPNSWQPAALARFIEKYGTHIITGIKIGGKDVVYLRQHQSSRLDAADMQRCLESITEQRFADSSGNGNRNLKVMKKGARKKVADPFSYMDRLTAVKNYSSHSFMSKDDVEVIFRRKGGDEFIKDHNQWLASVPYAPEVISMSFVAISSLVSGVLGSGFLTHAINLYLRYKPPIDELQYFLEFQVPRQWSPSFDIPTRSSAMPSLQFSLIGPRLYVNTSEVLVGKRPVTGFRLALEGKKANRLAIQLQYLSSLPKILESCLSDDRGVTAPLWKRPEEDDRYIEHVQWKSFSHVNTAPVDYVEQCIGDEAGAYIVTGAQLQVTGSRSRNVLWLRLHFSRLPRCSIRRSAWDHSAMTSQKASTSGFFSQLGFSTTGTSVPEVRPARFVHNSAVFSGGRSPALQQSKALKTVDVSEMVKGSQDQPGHWIVTGAKLDVELGKICLRVKYSLLKYIQ